MAEPRVVLTDIVMGESARWHDGRLWFCDWGAGEVIRLDDEGPTVVATNEGLPFCIDWIGDDLVVLDGPAALLRRAGSDFSDLSPIDGAHPWNDIATDSRGNVFVNNIGYDFPGGTPRPGLIAVVTPDGEPRVVADGLEFPNGMAVTPDDATLIVAESHASRLTAFDIAPDGALTRRRVWAALPGAAPDGICLDPSGAIWYAAVPNRHCQLIHEGGEIVTTIPLPDGAFDCALTPDGRTLYALTADYTNPAAMFSNRTGRLFAVDLA
ncbi:SMP-30/gluconolactonase/LRE family protein [Actinoplanes sp. CA-030573]|uniref:SMP-30/gluconolactonase/LRE family protein n=1 Tax=Actinoplanes sp. CA-030573 TaxID=3239898 RepID=UPI003D9252B7